MRLSEVVNSERLQYWIDAPKVRFRREGGKLKNVGDQTPFRMPPIQGDTERLRENPLPLFSWAEIVQNTHSHGMKCVALSQEMFDSLARTKCVVPLADYRQPFPVLWFQFPDGSHAVSLAPEGGGVIMWIIPEPKYFAPRDYFCWLSSETFCDTYRGYDEEEEDERAANDKRFRAMVNACLLLAYNGHRDGGASERPEKPRGNGKQRRAIERANARIGQWVEFNQSIDFKPSQEAASPDQEPTGTRKKPHWRCGHMRTVRKGKGRTDRALVWIRPVFINANLMGRPLGDTDYQKNL